MCLETLAAIKRFGREKVTGNWIIWCIIAWGFQVKCLRGIVCLIKLRHSRVSNLGSSHMSLRYLSGLEWLREPISNMEAIFAVMNTTEENISYLQVALWCYIYYINNNEMPIHFTLFFPNLAKKFRLALRSCVVFFFVFLIGSLSLTLYTQTSACLFSILFFIHFLWHWQYLIQQWYLVEILDDRQPQRWNGVAMCLSTLSSQSSMNLDLEIKLDWIVIGI